MYVQDSSVLTIKEAHISGNIIGSIHKATIYIVGNATLKNPEKFSNSEIVYQSKTSSDITKTNIAQKQAEKTVWKNVIRQTKPEKQAKIALIYKANNKTQDAFYAGKNTVVPYVQTTSISKSICTKKDKLIVFTFAKEVRKKIRADKSSFYDSLHFSSFRVRPPPIS